MSQLALLKTRRFYPLFWTQFFGAFNDNVLKNALVILITFQAQEIMKIPVNQMVAVCGGIFILPFFLFSATSGQIADKYEKTRVIRLIKFAEIGIMILGALGFLFEQVQFLLLVLFLMGLHSTLFGPLKYSILPQLLEEDELIGGNALIESGTFLAILLGTILGGILITLNPHGPYAVSGVLLIVAVLGYYSSLAIPVCPAADPKLKVDWNPILPTWEIIGFSRKNKPVFLSILGISWFWFFGAAVLSLLPPYCKDVLRSTEGSVTLFLAIFSIGIGVGSLLCEKLSDRRLELGLVPFGSVGITLFTADLYFAGIPSFVFGVDTAVTVPMLLNHWEGVRIALDLLLFSVFSGFFIVPLYTLIQERSEASHRSRIVAANNILNALFMVFATGLLVAFFGWGLNVPQIFLVLAIMNACVGIYIYSVVPEFFLRFVAWILAHLMYRVEVRGKENIPHTGPVVLVCNHVTFIDWLIVFAVCRRPVRFVMDHLYDKGVTRILFRGAKVISISPAHENLRVLREGFKKIAQELSEGEVLCIFPEGSLTRDGKIAPFRSGIERIIEASPVPVVPMALQGLWGSVFSRKNGARSLARLVSMKFRAPVRLVIGSAIPAQEVSASGLHERVKRLLSFA